MMDVFSSGYALFLDDDEEFRFPPEKPARNWIIARSFREGVDVVERLGCPDYLSLDHDLGQDAVGHDLPSGLDFAKWLVDQHLNGKLQFKCQWIVHSLNPIGADNIRAYLRSFERSQGLASLGV